MLGTLARHDLRQEEEAVDAVRIDALNQPVSLDELEAAAAGRDLDGIVFVQNPEEQQDQTP